MADLDSTDLEVPTTLTLTKRERLMLAQALTMAMAMVDALGRATDEHLALWERVQPDGIEF